ncbi:MAG: 3D domain-containing protein [Eubacterium sp.]|nr:3D domain-containing protein [Eubacterium sp.]
MNHLKFIAGGMLLATSMMTIVSFHSVTPEVKETSMEEAETLKVVKLVNEANLLQSANDTNEKSTLVFNTESETSTVEVTEGKLVIEEKTIETEETTKKEKNVKKTKKTKKSKVKKANKTKKVKKAKKRKKASNKKSKKEAYTYVGEFKITGYCGCASCCGKTNCITASGTRATAGRTIAADTSRFSFGTKLKIGDNVYTVEDRGGAIHGNRIDIFFASHSEALQWGVRYCEVYVKN